MHETETEQTPAQKFEAENKANAVKRFVELGPVQVRGLMAMGGLPTAWQIYAIHWLAENDDKAGRQAEKVEVKAAGSRIIKAD